MNINLRKPKVINYNNKTFVPVCNSENGETSSETVFLYKQDGNIKKGHLIGLVDAYGNIDMRYHQINLKGELMTGRCTSKPEIMDNGKIRLHESWQWTSGDQSKGETIIEEQ